jgi:soluble lytic murein transglycosylase-like protein
MQNAIYMILLRWLDNYLQKGTGSSGSAVSTGSTKNQPRQADATAAGTSGGSFDSLINSIASEYNVDPRLVSAVVQTESNFDPNAESAAGAQGLMQLMPATASDLGVTNPLDPSQNLEGGVKYLRNMLDRYDGNVSLALAAYNAGPGSVSKYGGIPPYAETQAYVQRVLGIYQA